MQVTALVDGRPIGGGAVDLGGARDYRLSNLLPPDGRLPSASDNGISGDKYGTEWILRRTQQLVALFDHPLYSFFDGVEALTNESMRTTTSIGMGAVRELYGGSSGAHVRGRFYAPMPGTMYDEQRMASATRKLPSDIIRGGGSKKRTANVMSATGPDGFPVVGRIGADSVDPFAPPDSKDDKGYEDDAGRAAREALAAEAREGRSDSLAAARDAQAGKLQDEVDLDEGKEYDPSEMSGKKVVGSATDMQRNASVPDATVTAGDRTDGKVEGLVSDPTKNARATNGEYVYDVENGEGTLLRRLNGTTPLSAADLDAWRVLYAGGAGVTAPVPRRDPSQDNATRSVQRQQIDDFADTMPADFDWRITPENLRVLFLTPRARAALEHAAWFAEFQQPSDPHIPGLLQTPNSRFSSDRQRVPVIDLMTHKQVRVPFQTLVAHIILYWKHRRLADTQQMKLDLDQINQVMMTLRTMREETNGFVSLMGHYDLEAQKSRFDTAESRMAHLANTGRYHSDMDREFYSGAARPGSNVARLMSSAHSSAMTLSQDAALANALRAAGPAAGHYDVARDARARYAITASIFSAMKM